MDNASAPNVPNEDCFGEVISPDEAYMAAIQVGQTLRVCSLLTQERACMSAEPDVALQMLDPESPTSPTPATGDDTDMTVMP